MKKIVGLIIVLLYSIGSYSQDYRTGSPEFDADLTLINRDARSNMLGFRTQMKAEYSLSDSKFEHMSLKLGMSPGDIYFALQLGKQARMPIDQVLVVYGKHKGKGWGVVAKECGIKPGSPEFHAMKSHAGGKAKKGKGKPHNDKGNKHDKHKGGGKTMPDYKTGGEKNRTTTKNPDYKGSTQKSKSGTMPDYKKGGNKK